VVVSFVAATACTEYLALSITRLADQIADSDAPAIEQLASGRAELRRFTSALHDYARHRPGVEAADVTLIWRRAYDQLRTYDVVPSDAQAARMQAELRERLSTLQAQVDEALAGNVSVVAARAPAVSAAADRAAATSLELLELHADGSRHSAVAIRRTHRFALGAALVLDGIAAILSVFAARLLIWWLRRQSSIIAAQHRAVQEKVNELELFSARLAHDIAGPISATVLALDIAERTSDPDERARVLARGRRTLGRAGSISSALLEFARSGARPGADARCDLEAVISGVLEDLQPSALQAGVSLQVAPLRSCAIACAPGILTTLVENLVRNAIKYTRGFPDAQVLVRTTEYADYVCVEVADNGAGLPDEIEAHVFDPYVRFAKAGQEGIGLGLATVKRMATAHGGDAGVRNHRGQGCTFWFDLPRAKSDATTAGAR
jgi:signal transduction histidine kinase